MQRTIDPSALATTSASSLAGLVRRLALAGVLLAVLTILASIALTVQN